MPERIDESSAATIDKSASTEETKQQLIERAALSFLNFQEKLSVLRFFSYVDLLEFEAQKGSGNDITRETRIRIVREAEDFIPGARDAVNKMMVYYNWMLDCELQGQIQ